MVDESTSPDRAEQAAKAGTRARPLAARSHALLLT